MNDNTITCPNCDAEFELTNALTMKIREDLKRSLQADVAKREVALKAKETELRERETSVEASVDAQVKERLRAAEKSAEARLRTEFKDDLDAKQEQLDRQAKALAELRKNELELRREREELEDSKASLELEITRTLDAERAKIRKDAEEKSAESHRLKDLEKDKTIQDLRRALDDAKRRAEQGSVETQGEVLELDFEAKLRSLFPHDEFQPVAKGVRGADILQVVRKPLGATCGSILWELKNAKGWGGKWIPKLKDDVIDARASIGALVSTSLPDGVGRFGLVEGVWVSDPLSAVPLAVALRQQIVALDAERETSVGKNEKMDLLYQYLAGPEFKQKIEGIVEAFTSMQDQVARERRAMEKQWKEREKQIERVVKNTAGLYGDMQGIIGGRIPEIQALELDLDEGAALNSPPSDAADRDVVQSGDDQAELPTAENLIPSNSPTPRFCR